LSYIYPQKKKTEDGDEEVTNDSEETASSKEIYDLVPLTNGPEILLQIYTKEKYYNDHSNPYEQ
jgi:hypothetical protein